MRFCIGFFISSLALFSPIFGSEILCIGNALVDTFAFVSDEELAKTGVEKGGEASVSTRFFDNQIFSLSTEAKRLTGGSAANTAKGLGQLGGSVSLLARTGDDEAGALVRLIMKENGVHLCSTQCPGTTSRVLCLITPDGQRSFLFCGGTAGKASPCELDEAEYKEACIVHHDGYILRNKPLLEASLALASKWHVRTSLDLGAFSLVREHRNYILEEILPHIDILIGNSDEMHALLGSDQEIENALVKRRSLSVFLKGPEGCRLYLNGRAFDVSTVPQKALDTTGAGDLFTSGFLYGLSKGWSLEDASLLGHRLAGTVILHVGAAIPSDAWGAIRHELNSYKPKLARDISLSFTQKIPSVMKE